MADKREALEAWQRFKENIDSRYKRNLGVRYAITGDGRGAASSNYYYQGQDDKIWVREYGREDSPFPVTNRGRVRAAINVPVVLGYDDLDPGNEQVLGVNYAGLPSEGIPGGSNTTIGIGNHHQQHEWGGGDEVYIDSRQFTPGLVYETVPPTMTVKIKPFIYHYGGRLIHYSGGSSSDLSDYLPSGSTYRYVGISFDRSTGSIVYQPGEPSSAPTSTYLELLEGGGTTQTSTDLMPILGTNHIPLATVYLGSATSIVSALYANNLLDSRLHVDTPSDGPIATAIGQIQISLDGQSFSAKIPLTDKHAGLLFDSHSGYMIVA